MIDLRSDTVTKPTSAMRHVILNSEVGDDIYGEDPSVNALEAYAAKLFDKEAALFLTSGTQGNTIAILAQTEPGSEVLVEKDAHIFWYEGGAASAIGGVQLHPVPGHKGVMEGEDIEARIRAKGNVHFPQTALVCVENTHNRAGGTCWSLNQLKEVKDVADNHDLKVHMDGARIFNASIATGVLVKDYAKYVDTVQFCLSKGLGAPVGSILVGPEEVIEKARFWRKRLGGAMRQAGIIASAGLYALKNNVDRLALDHKLAKKLATGLQDLGLDVNPLNVQTNMVMLPYTDCESLLLKLKKKGVLAGLSTPDVIRFVTHLDVTEEDIDTTLKTISELI